MGLALACSCGKSVKAYHRGPGWRLRWARSETRLPRSRGRLPHHIRVVRQAYSHYPPELLSSRRRVGAAATAVGTWRSGGRAIARALDSVLALRPPRLSRLANRAASERGTAGLSGLGCGRKATRLREPEYHLLVVVQE